MFKKENKSVFIIVRLTKTEKAGILAKAGKNISRYIRMKLGFRN